MLVSEKIEEADKRKCCSLYGRFCLRIQRDKFFNNSKKQWSIFPTESLPSYCDEQLQLGHTMLLTLMMQKYNKIQTYNVNRDLWSERVESNSGLDQPNKSTENIIKIKLTSTVYAVLSIDLLVIPLKTWFLGYSHSENQYKEALP